MRRGSLGAGRPFSSKIRERAESAGAAITGSSPLRGEKDSESSQRLT